MRIYLSNHSSPELHYLAGKFGRIGWLLTPEGLKSCKPRYWLPLAFDNGAWSAYQNKTEWEEKPWFEMLDRIRKDRLQAEWVLAPDSVGDKEDTLRKYHAYSGYMHGFKIAYALQDGMLPGKDIPCTSDVLFLGGTDDFKWKTLPLWRMAYPDKILHVGRVNSLEKLIICEQNGVDSIDGTHWFRFKKSDVWRDELEYFLSGEYKRQGILEGMG